MQKSNPYIVTLGIAQDAGYPQANCNKSCCAKAWKDITLSKYVSCIAIVDPISKEQWLFDATPDIKFQLHLLEKKSKINQLSGIFLTHAHVGHYTGLLQLGKEVMGIKDLAVYSMNRMRKFLKYNEPWKQLVNLNNIKLKPLSENITVELNNRVSVTPFLVPHRDEFSETVGYKITIIDKNILYIPDIDKWEQWEFDIVKLIPNIECAFIDATFYQDGELNRDMSKIPHPYVKESMKLFSSLSEKNKQKIYFIHLNHTNPLLINGSDAQKNVLNSGFRIAQQGQIISFK